MEVYWTTVTYRSVFLMIVAALTIILVGWWLVHPASLKLVAGKIGEKLAGDSSKQAVGLSNQARFVALDGRVQVRKIGSLQFVGANHQMALEKGDVIQTGPDGLARIAFANGTTYTVQSDTLITVESSTMGGQVTAGAEASVSVKSGAVDLSTTTSAAEVAFEDAVARVNENSRANVRSDPQGKQHEITLTSGTAEVRRGGELIPIVRYERVSFETGGQTTKSKILAPPELVAPLNLQPIVVDNPKQYGIKFEWRPVTGAVEYHLRIAASSSFTQLVAERKSAAPQVTVANLDPGDYFWVVTAIDAKRGSSQPSDVYKFVLAQQGKGQSMLLEVEEPIVHGTVVEVNGRTEPGAALIINGQPVPKIEPDGKFKYFTPPMARGAQAIKITGQNRRGGYAQKDVRIFIP
jgi:hypothetical protein